VVRWNTDKRYLRELADAGLPVVPTAWLEPGEPLALPAGEFVVKPTVSAGAAETARYAPHEAEDAEVHVGRLHDAGAMVMVQPYIDAVDTHGETALIYLGGEFSHAMRKGQILFRGQGVQPIILDTDEREQMSRRQASTAERELADRVLAAVPGGAERLLFARVDLLPGPDGPLLIELELTEPSLFLGYADGAADRFAAAIAGSLARSA
jgi:glutathione synthase/RimK-type ligase-like ATP-grasp enzyme